MEEVKKTTTRKKVTGTAKKEAVETKITDTNMSVQTLAEEQMRKMLEEMLEKEREKIRQEEREKLLSEVKQDNKKEIEELNNEKSKIDRKIQVRNDVDWNREVLVRSVCHGVLGVATRDGGFYSFEDYGDEHFITLRELKSLKASTPRYFLEPWFIVDDEEAVEILRLQSVYDKYFRVDNIIAFFNNNKREDIVNILKDTPQYHRMNMIERLFAMYKEDKKSVSADIRELIQELYGIRLEDRL